MYLYLSSFNLYAVYRIVIHIWESYIIDYGLLTNWEKNVGKLKFSY